MINKPRPSRCRSEYFRNMLPGQIDGVRRVSVDNRGCTGHRAACRRGPRVGENAWNGFILIFEKSFHSEKNVGETEK